MFKNDSCNSSIWIDSRGKTCRIAFRQPGRPCQPPVGRVSLPFPKAPLKEVGEIYSPKNNPSSNHHESVSAEVCGVPRYLRAPGAAVGCMPTCDGELSLSSYFHHPTFNSAQGHITHGFRLQPPLDLLDMRLSHFDLIVSVSLAPLTLLTPGPPQPMSLLNGEKRALVRLGLPKTRWTRTSTGPSMNSHGIRGSTSTAAGGGSPLWSQGTKVRFANDAFSFLNADLDN